MIPWRKTTQVDKAIDGEVAEGGVTARADNNNNEINKDNNNDNNDWADNNRWYMVQIMIMMIPGASLTQVIHRQSDSRSKDCQTNLHIFTLVSC